jgi:ligand-binding sensor domain-containing protein/signal transduction histidine kinase
MTPRSPVRWDSRWLAAGLCALVNVSPLWAKEPPRAISQYVREHWDHEKGLPSGQIYAIAQTADGYLWIGSEKGLVRFDGLNFQLFQYSNAAAAPMGPVLGLTSDVEGNLWIRLEGASLLRYRDGVFEDVSTKLGQPEVAVTAMAEGRDGSALFGTLVNGILRHHSGQFERIARAPSMPNFLPISMVEAKDGTIWMGTRDAGLLQLKKGQPAPEPKMMRASKINCLLADKGQLWIGTDNGLARWTGGNLVPTDLPPPLHHGQVLAMVRDRESNIWIGSAAGLFRFDASGVFERNDAQDVPTGGVTAAFVDREGNLWTGSTKGLDQFRESAFTSFSQREGLPSDNGGAVYGDQEGRTWFAPSGGGLYRLEDGKFEDVRAAGLKKEIVYSIAGGKDGIWVGRQRGGLTHIRYRAGVFDLQTYTKSDGLAQNSVYVVYEAREGTVWAGTLSGGVSEFREGRFSNYTTDDGLVSNTVTAILESANGTMWFGTARGVSALSNGRWSSYGTSSGLPAEEVNCLLEDSSGVLWIGTVNGFAAIRSGHVWVPSNIPYSLREAILGIALDRSGSMWISTTSHIVRVSRDSLLHGDLTDSDIREYRTTDGLRGEAGVKRALSVISDRLGRIWFSTNRGLSFVAPDNQQVAPPAIVKIEQIAADGHTFNLFDAASIPGPHHRVTLSYTGLSLSIPDRVRFKYMLESFDQKWSEPTNSREATYTNLDSGTYRFHVMASNSDGQWNSTESVAQFEIEPLLWQRWWFRLIEVTAIVLIALLFYRVRMLQLSRQLSLRFEERLSERTRIARELHDTLLQSLHGLLFRFQAARNMFEHRPKEAMEALDGAIARTEQAIAESQDAITDLRPGPAGHSDLRGLLAATAKELQTGDASANPATFEIIVEGEGKTLSPILQVEVYRIARELLRNSFRHACARRVEAEIRYSDEHLRLRIRDDGKGMDPDVLKKGRRQGHWGLPGVKERAQQIGAQLEFWSEAGAGTEVQLTIPAAIAYKNSQDRPRFSFFRRVRVDEQRF